jgi:hypothetical protein
LRALSLTDEPQEAPTNDEVMLPSGTPNALASLALPASVSAGLSFSVCTRTVEVPSLVTTTSALPAAPLSADRPVCSKSWVWVTPGTRNSEPPRNSSPKLSPRPKMPISARTMMPPEMAYQSRCRPTKSLERRP